MYLSIAPLRIGLAGGSTDIFPYTHNFGGAVLNAAIDKFVFVRFSPIDGKKSHFKVNKGDVVETFSADLNNPQKNKYPNSFELICETCKYLLSENNLLSSQSVSIEIILDENLGGGLGTSSAIVVALISAFHHWLEIEIAPSQIANKAYYIERQILKHAGGKQDQYSASFGGFNFIEFIKDEVQVEPLLLKDNTINQLSRNLLLYNTNKERISGNIIKDQQENLKRGQSIESLHFLKQQAYDLKKSLLAENINDLGEMLHQGWIHKKSTSDKISNPDLDMIYDEALKIGATGGKVLGAGGGGYMLFYCPTETIKQKLSEKLQEFGGKAVPFNFTTEGVVVKKI